jgi:hypothetical protein
MTLQVAVQRKARSEAILRAQGIPINPNLPVVESEDEVTLRSQDVVAYRTFSLLAVALRGEGLEQAAVERLIARYGLEPHLTPKEKAFLPIASPTEAERAQFSWRYESAWLLLWAMGYVEDPRNPSNICDVSRAVTILQQHSTEQFVANAHLRPLPEILDQVDLIYRCHWAVVDARIKNQPPPAGLDPGVVYERHYALNWLISYMDQDWDDVTTDT